MKYWNDKEKILQDKPVSKESAPTQTEKETKKTKK